MTVHRARTTGTPALAVRSRTRAAALRVVTLVCSLSVLASTLAGLVSARPAAAADDTPAVISTAQVQRALWVANAVQRLEPGPTAVKTAFHINTLMNMYAANATLASSEATAQLQALMTAVDAQPHKSLVGPQGNQVVADFLLLVKAAIPAVSQHGPVVQAAQLAYQTLANALTASSVASDRVTAVADLAVERAVVSGQQADILFRAVEMAHTPGLEQFKTAFDDKFAAATAAVRTPSQQLIAGNPALQNPSLTQMINADGSIQTTRAQLKTKMTEQINTIQGRLDALVKPDGDLDKIAKAQSDTLGFLKDKPAQDKLAAEQKARSAEHLKAIELGKSGVDVLVDLMEWTNKRLGIQNDPLPKQVAVVGKAAADMAVAAVKFADLASSMGGVLSALGSASGIALTGNFVGAALQIVSLFAGSSDGAKDRTVLDQIGKLQTQLTKLGTQMSSRFDKVDRALNKIYQDMMKEFNQIDATLGIIRTDLATIQQNLNQLRDQLTAFEGNLYAVILSTKRFELWDWVDRALGYQPRTGQPLPFSDAATNYLDADSKFFTWARQFAFSAAATGGSNLRSFKDGEIASELTKFYEPEHADVVSPLSTNVKYLNELPAAWQMSPLVAEAVPNPLDWYLGARAYHALNLESPVNAGQNLQVQNEIGTIVTAGRKFQAFEQAIVAGARDDQGLNPLFQKLLQRYRAKADQLDGEIATKIEAPYKVDKQIDPFHASGVDQSIPDPRRSKFADIPFCAGAMPNERPLGPKAVDVVMPSPMQISQNYAANATTSICATAEWGERDVFRSGNTYMYRARMIVRLLSTVTSSAFEGGPVITAEAITEPFVWCTEPVSPEPQGECPEVPDATEEANANWGTVKATLENARIVSVNQPVYDRVRANATTYLRSVEAELYQTIGNALGGSLLPFSRELNGAKVSLEAYVKLGMPAALAGDEVLSAMLLGTDGIRDQKSLTSFLLTKAAPTGSNARIKDKTDNDQRVAFLTAALVKYLDLYRAGYSDGSVAVRSTINRLVLLSDLLNTQAVNILPTAGEHSFGRVPAGSTKDLTLTVANPGVAKVTLSSVTVEGAGFSLVDKTCGAELVALATCSVKIRFAPTSGAAATGALKVLSNARVSPAAARLSGNTGTGLSVNDVSVAEGNTGSKQVTFTVTRSGDLSGPSSVVWATADGTAVAGSDYVAVPPTTLTFAGGEAAKTVSVVVNGDTADEPNETFSVKLTNPSGGVVDDDTGMATIVNDDAAAFSVSDVRLSEPASGTAPARFVITRSGTAAGTSSVQWRTVNGTAVSPADYDAVPVTSLTFAPGETSRAVWVPVKADTVVEADETFFVKLSSPTGATIADDSGTGTIVNDKPWVAVSHASVTEGNAGTTQATFTISRGGDRSAPLSVQWSTINGTATAGCDFAGVAPTTLTFAAGEASKTVSVTVNGDTAVEADETFYVRLTAPAGVIVARIQGTATVVNDDTSFAISDVTVVEPASGATAATFTVTRSGKTTGTSSVQWRTVNGTAVSPADYDAVAATTLTFSAGETSKTVSVAVRADTVVEADETFFVKLSSPTGATIADDSGSGTIVNDKQWVAVSHTSLNEGNAGTSPATFTISRGGDRSAPLSVQWSTINGTATAGSDYVAVAPTTLTFAAGEATKTVSVAVNGDTAAEANETFYVRLTAPAGIVVARIQGTATVVNDDT